MASDMVRGWVRDAERDVAEFEKLDAKTLLREFRAVCADVIGAGEEFSPAFANATQKAIVVVLLLAEACGRETDAKGMQQ